MIGKFATLGCLAALTALAATASAQASTFDLSNDFSYTSNPNGAWSFVDGSPLSNVGSPVSNGNSLIPAIGSSGYYSTGNDLYVNTPDVLKTVVNGTRRTGNDADGAEQSANPQRLRQGSGGTRRRQTVMDANKRARTHRHS